MKEFRSNRLVKFAIMAAVAFLAGCSASASDPPSIQGRYAFTGIGSCLVSPGGFTGLAPTTGVGVISTNAWEGVYTFRRDGTGTVAATLHGITFPNQTTVTSPSASTSQLSYNFTYTVDTAGNIAFTTVPGTFLGCGPDCATPGHFEFRLSSGPQRGVIAPDSRTILVTCGAPIKITQSPPAASVSDPANAVCNVSYVLTWMGD